jgi:hypothetical protein
MMSLTKTQNGVLWRMVIGVLIAIAIVTYGSFFNWLSLGSAATVTERLTIAIQSLLLPVVFLVISVGRLAKHRFFTPEDIDSDGYSQDTERAMILQSILQNTLEQFCIASTVYLAWAVIMPADTASVIPLAAVAFSIGRILFFAGYSRGAASRAFGFTLTFYPSVVMLIYIFGHILWQQFS